MSDTFINYTNLDQKYKDIKRQGTTDFPIAAYKFVVKHDYSPANKRSNLAPHWHEEIEMYYLKRGKCKYFINGVCFELNDGDTIFTPPRCYHWMNVLDSEKDFVSYAIVFNPEILYAMGDMVSRKYIPYLVSSEISSRLHMDHSISWQSEVGNLVKMIFGFFDDDDFPDDGIVKREETLERRSYMFGAELKIKSLLFDILYLYVKNTPIISSYNKTSKPFENSIDYIHKHYSEKIHLSDLASIVSVSKEYYTRIFHNIMGCQPFVYLNNYRILKSLELLETTDLKIIDVAEKCGFENVSYFNQQFKKIMKTTPSEYRKSMLKKTISQKSV